MQVIVYWFNFREILSQREAELRMKGIHPITSVHPLIEQPMSSQITSDTPMTAALGAGRIADLKSQLVKAKVNEILKESVYFNSKFKD